MTSLGKAVIFFIASYILMNLRLNIIHCEINYIIPGQVTDI